MPNPLRSRLALVALLALAPAAALRPARAQEQPVARPVEVAVETLAGKRLEARALTALSPEKLTVDVGGSRRELAMTEVIALQFATRPDPVRAPSPDEVALDLWSGEELRGRIVGGGEDSLELEAPLLGKLSVQVDAIAGVRFLARLARVADPPDLTSDAEHDVLHLTGGDRIEGGIESFGKDAVVAGREDGEPRPVPYDRLTALRLARYEAKPVSGLTLHAVLRDGSRVTGVEPRLEGDRLLMTSRSAFAVSTRLADVVELHVRSDAFAYLSDRKPGSIEVKPFWEMSAGDPKELYAPRFDRSFAGRRLTCGGRNWTKGIGVFGGTRLTYALDGGYSELRGHVGLDDGAGDLGGVVFRVIVDGKTVWDSGFVRAAGTEGRGKEGPLPIGKVSLKGAKELVLAVATGDDVDPYPIQDEADWLGVLLVR